MMGSPNVPIPAKVSLDEQIASVIREAGLRARVYPGWIERKKLTTEKAAHELAAMNAVLATVRDYKAMQPKVLALSAVCLTLSHRLDMDKEALDALLEKAEADAVHQLQQAKGAIEQPMPPPWPFPRGARP